MEIFFLIFAYYYDIPLFSARFFREEVIFVFLFRAVHGHSEPDTGYIILHGFLPCIGYIPGTAEKPVPVFPQGVPEPPVKKNISRTVRQHSVRGFSPVIILVQNQSARVMKASGQYGLGTALQDPLSLL